ncbi:Fur-regulated basic protein FbpA [Heyndrickxia ginsengihumi]|uniref:Fur-regulated basic protein FbpA n=1 Tax=Heyndrickxia ginsengihumi TaxID=363870 RepID=A0A0A6VB40_9BACI|nr:Fur-regulated basic protein FbpA [Heyndrickxia ginsengihumi]KHD84728.1 hypothetical protein NG54_13525 [Heyndrickxia ginsengihumi]MBE6184488.1 Fur-regulated basic protein FbpA [Bacillus sp. (in: firmicutes)]MCM3023527.1 Fur-regulated basic protein FbpA [Heyndrickxia ginsengihumi]NEY20318.1 Fur-regulated basic protein FbpA [Heyndrickxia ginsengihumi]
MGKLHQAVENRRNELINKLIAFDIYKKEGKHLFELTLSELEAEYKALQSNFHPHCEVESIHWINKN